MVCADIRRRLLPVFAVVVAAGRGGLVGFIVVVAITPALQRSVVQTFTQVI